MMTIPTRIMLTIGLLMVSLLPFACNGGSGVVAPPLAGAASGLNTFIYVYSDT